ncbi:MAG TPA: CpsD/CapB family tyrosine-protein kinase [Cellulomonas sp.]
MTVRELLRAIGNARWFVLPAVVIVVLASYVYAQKQVITYRAAVSVQLATIDDKVAAAAGVQALVNPDLTAVTAPAVLQTASASSGVSANGLAKRVTASFNVTTHAVDIAVDAPTVGEAVATVNAVANAYAATVPAEIQAQLADIDKQVTDQHNRLTAAQDQLAKDPNDQFAQADITAAVARYQALSDALSAYQRVATPARVETPATTAIPLGLGPTAILALGVLAGLVVGLGVAMAHRGLSNRLRTAAEAARIAKVPVIAELEDVPRAVRAFRVRGLLPVAGRAATPYTESIRELRTALRISMSQRPHAVVVVTAVDTAAPRAFIAANLAASWALSGRRTVIVGGDMRRSEIAEMLPLAADSSPEPGAPRATLVPNLSVLLMPDSPLDPADYLATDEVRARIEELRADAEVIVIDAPPVLAAADATILSTYADGAVLVTTVDKSERTTLEAASERLRVSGVTVFGVVLSGVGGSRRKSYASSYGTDVSPAARHMAPSTPTASATSPAQPGAADEQSPSSAPTPAQSDTWLPTDAPGAPRLAAPRRTVSRPVRVPEDESPIPIPALDDSADGDEIVARAVSTRGNPA